VIQESQRLVGLASTLGHLKSSVVLSVAAKAIV
jgi:hypothetical protein